MRDASSRQLLRFIILNIQYGVLSIRHQIWWLYAIDVTAKSTAKMIERLGKYKVHPVAALFPLMQGEEFATLTQSIQANGLQEPIVLAPDGVVIVDGRNRWRACQKAGIEPRVRTLGKSYSEHEIIEFIIGANVHRRHLDAGQRALIGLAIEPYLQAEAKERQREHGKTAPGKKKSLPTKSSEVIGDVRDQIAALFNVGAGTVSVAKKVKNNSPTLAADVLAGKITLNEANKQVRAKPTEPKEAPATTSVPALILKTHLGEDVAYPAPKSQAAFNRTNDQVSWSAWTWNPVTGCLHGCKYCYAREMAEMRDSYRAYYPVGFTPLFHHERLDAPANTKVPPEAEHDARLKRVFVCSMADLYGKWVPDEWIERVHASCIGNPQWDYLLLTKFPRRYVGLQLPPTAWLGTSVDEQKRVRLAEEAFSQIQGVRVKWLSLEPLLAPLEFSDLSMFDWVVIGSQSSTEQPDGRVPEFAPPLEWVARIVAQARECGCGVYCKPNLMGKTDPQNAGMVLPQELPRRGVI